MLRQKLKRLIEQPSIPLEIFRGIRPGHSKSFWSVKKLLKEKKLAMLIDVGANKGEFLKAGLFHFPNLKIHAFEPLKEHHKILQEIKNVKLHPFGLWNKNEKRILYINEREDTQSSFLNPNTFIPKERKLELKKFNDLGIKINRPCFLKIDVEGAEDRVLEGFEDILKQIDFVQIEVLHQKYVDEKARLSNLVKILEDKGFKGFMEVNITFERSMPAKSDLLFFKNQKF